MNYEDWLAPSGYGYFDVAGDGHRTFTLDPMRRTGEFNEGGMLPPHIGRFATSGNNDPGELTRQWFDRLSAPDASGRAPWGTSLIPFNDSGSAWDPTRASVNIGGQERIQTGTDLNGILSPELQDLLRKQGVDPAALISYDPTYGYNGPADTLRSLYPARQAEALSSEDFIDRGGLGYILMTLATAGIASGAALGAGAAGVAEGAGGGLTLADAGSLTGTLTDALPAAAGSFGDSGVFANLYEQALAGAGPFAGASPSTLAQLAQIYNSPGGIAARAGSSVANFLGGGQDGMLQSIAPNFPEQTPAFTGPGTTGLNVSGGSSSFLSDLFTPKNLLSAGTSLASTAGNIFAANKAVGAQTDSANLANQTLWNMYQQNRADLEPWRVAGGHAVGRLDDLTTPGKQVSSMEMDPGYDFRLGEGLKALERSAAARGNLLSGGTLKGITKYGQGFASNEFNNVFNRNASLAGLGQTAVNTGVQAGANTANNVANNQTGIGNARASGYVGTANAITGGLSSIINNMQQQDLIDTLSRR